SARPNDVSPALADDVGQQPEEARALDRLRQLALLFRRHRGDAARYDLAALGNVALQQPHILVIDLRRIGAGERAGLAATEKRAARGRGECHGLFLRSRCGGLVGVIARPTIAAAAITTITIATVETAATAAVEAIAAVAMTVIAVDLAHHRRRPFLELVDADGDIAQHVFT